MPQKPTMTDDEMLASLGIVPVNAPQTAAPTPQSGYGSTAVEFAKGAAKGLGRTVVGAGKLMASIPLSLYPGGKVITLADVVDAGYGALGIDVNTKADLDTALRDAVLTAQNPAQDAGLKTEQVAEFFALPQSKGTLLAKGVTNALGSAVLTGAQTGDAGASAASGAIGLVAPAITKAGSALKEKAVDLVRSGLKPTVTALRRIPDSSSKGLDVVARRLARFIIDNRLTTPEKAEAIVKASEKELNGLIAANNATTDAAVRAEKVLFALRRNARKQLIPAKDVAAISEAASEFINSSPLMKTVGVVDAAGNPVLDSAGNQITQRVARTDVTAREALDLARGSSKWGGKKRWAERGSVAEEVDKKIELAARNAVKDAVPGAEQVLAREGKAIDAKRTLDAMRNRLSNRDAFSLPTTIAAATETAAGRPPVISFMDHWFRKNQLRAGIWADQLGSAIQNNNVQKVLEIAGRLGVSVPSAMSDKTADAPQTAPPADAMSDDEMLASLGIVPSNAGTGNGQVAEVMDAPVAPKPIASGSANVASREPSLLERLGAGAAERGRTPQTDVANPKTGMVTPTVPAGEGLFDGPITGVPQVGRGLAGAVEAAKTRDPKVAANALSDLAEGAMQVGSPLILPALVAAPVTTPVMMALATVASDEAGKFGQKMGWSPEYVRLAQNAAALSVLGVGSRRIVKGIGKMEAAAADQGRAIGEFYRNKGTKGGVEASNAPVIDVTPQPTTPVVGYRSPLADRVANSRAIVEARMAEPGGPVAQSVPEIPYQSALSDRIRNSRDIVEQQATAKPNIEERIAALEALVAERAAQTTPLPPVSVPMNRVMPEPVEVPRRPARTMDVADDASGGSPLVPSRSMALPEDAAARPWPTDVEPVAPVQPEPPTPEPMVPAQEAPVAAPVVAPEPAQPVEAEVSPEPVATSKAEVARADFDARKAKKRGKTTPVAPVEQAAPITEPQVADEQAYIDRISSERNAAARAELAAQEPEVAAAETTSEAVAEPAPTPEDEAAAMERDTNAKLWALKGTLTWRLLGDREKLVWEPAEGMTVRLPSAPSEFTFSVVRDTKNNEWVVQEDSTGRSLASSKSKDEAIAEADSRIKEKGADALRSAIESFRGEAIPARPSINVGGKPRKTYTPKATKPNAEEVETPTEAAAEVETEVRRVVKTEGLKSGAEVQSAVINALQKELAGARQVESARAEWEQFYNDAMREWDKANPVANFDNYGKRSAARDAYMDAAVGPFRYGENPTITIEIPGDGTFTIPRDTKSINAVIKKISGSNSGLGGKRIWDDVTKPGMAKRGSALKAWEAAGKPMPPDLNGPLVEQYYADVEAKDAKKGRK